MSLGRGAGARVFTVLLYLNEVEEGGETVFPWLNLTVTPQCGRALIWPNTAYHNHQELNKSTKHLSLAVVTGEKYAATQWVHTGAFRM